MEGEHQPGSVGAAPPLQPRDYTDHGRDHAALYANQSYMLRPHPEDDMLRPHPEDDNNNINGYFSSPNTINDDGDEEGVQGANLSSKRKRGRPRKYGIDNALPLAFSSAAAAAASPAAASSPNPSESSCLSLSEPRMPSRGRGRPNGSLGKKKKLAAFGTLGTGFTPHVIIVPPGEDVASKILSFSQQGPHLFCILSASGAISDATFKQIDPYGNCGTSECAEVKSFKGRFELISLSCSISAENDGQTRTSRLSASLATNDSQVIGGVVGMLIAASTVQVVVGSFTIDKKDLNKLHNDVYSTALANSSATNLQVSQFENHSSFQLNSNFIPLPSNSCQTSNHNYYASPTSRSYHGRNMEDQRADAEFDMVTSMGVERNSSAPYFLNR